MAPKSKKDRPSTPEEADTTDNKQIIEHLSKEIVTQCGYITTFRERLAFAALIGPFVLLSSFVVATKGSIPQKHVDCGTVWALAIAAISYLTIGGLSAYLDVYVTKQCDSWRREIVRLSRGEKPSEEKLTFHHRSGYFYVAFFVTGLVACAALSCVYWRIAAGSPPLPSP